MKYRDALLAFVLLFSSAVVAQENGFREVGPSDVGNGAVPLAAFDDRLNRSAANYMQKYPGASAARFIAFDSAYPADQTEYEASGKYAVLLLSALSHDADELPLAQVYVGGVKIELLGWARRDVPADSAAGKFFGPYRVDAFYAVSVAALRRDPTITADFAKNRTGFVVGSDRFVAPNFIATDQDPKAAQQPSLSVLRQMIAREYPGFGVSIGQGTP